MVADSNTGRVAMYLFVILAAVIACGEGVSKRPSIPAKDEQLDNMPDTSDPQVQKDLKCSACKAASREAWEALWGLHRLRQGKIQEFEYDDLFDNHCKSIKSKYGLLMRNNKPTSELSRNTAISRVQGIWVGTMVEDACAELLDRFQDKMVQEYTTARVYKDFQQAACHTWWKKGQKRCDIQGIIKDEL
jgi:hypothetical protein